MTSIKLYEGNCLDVLRKCPDNYMDSVVCDPPYGLSFMNKGWDYQVPSTEIWKECLRVLKPGGHLLAFGGTRSYHRLVVNIEDAGFEIRDQIMWIYGSGFPKSLNVAKAIEKEPIEQVMINGIGTFKAPDASKYEGIGTALKPANEPICLARKPLSEKTVAKNVLKHGVGGLNVDASRIGGGEERALTGGNKKGKELGGTGNSLHFGLREATSTTEGRFPANILFDEYAAGVLDEQSGQSKDSDRTGKGTAVNGNGKTMGHMAVVESKKGFGDSGGASRFFYVAKASKKDRGEGNTHPTVKPIKLMEYLIKLVTPEGGIVLDPFMGSGTTGVAAQNLGFGFRGIEMTPEYFKIAQARILGAAEEAV